MKKILFIVAGIVICACNVNVDTENKSKTDSFLQKADTTLEKWGDTAKEKLKQAGQEVKEEWKEHFGKDSGSKKLK